MILPSKSPYHHIWTDFLNGNLEICVSSEILLEYEEIIPEKISSHFAFILMEALTNCQNLIRITPAWRFDLIKKNLTTINLWIVQFVEWRNTQFPFPKVTVLSIVEFTNEI